MRSNRVILMIVSSILGFLSPVSFAQDDLSEEELAEIREAEEEAIEIEGTDYTPSFESISRGVKMNKDYDIPLEESFIPKIKETMKKLPF